jgi:ribosomal protein S17E
LKRIKLSPNTQIVRRIKSVIANKFSEVQDKVFDFDNKNKSVTSKRIRNEVYGMKPTDFIPFAES